MLIPPHVPWVLSKHVRAGDSAGRPALPPALPPAHLPLSLPLLVAHPPTTAPTNQSSSPYLSSKPLPWTSVQCKPEKPPSYSFISRFPSRFPQTLCLLLGLNAFVKGLCSHCCSTGFAAGWDRPVVALVTQSCSTVM